MVPDEESLISGAVADKILGAAIEVYDRFGPGWVKPVYVDALALELERKNILYRRKTTVVVTANGNHCKRHRFDFLVAEAALVDIRPIRSVTAPYRNRFLSCLKAMEKQEGLVIDFDGPSLVQGINYLRV
jgi:GxxExxY protein